MMTAGRISTLLHLALIVVLGGFLCSALEVHHFFSHQPHTASVICDNDLVDADDMVLPITATAGWLPPLPAGHGFPLADLLSALMLPDAIFQPPELG